MIMENNDDHVVFGELILHLHEARRRGFDGIAAHRLFSANIATTDMTVSGSGMLVSGSYFSVLGTNAALGRLFGPADDERVGEHFVAVLGHDY